MEIRPDTYYEVREGAQSPKVISNSGNEVVRRIDEEGLRSAASYGLSRLIRLFRKGARDAN